MMEDIPIMFKNFLDSYNDQEFVNAALAFLRTHGGKGMLTLIRSAVEPIGS